jgi:hypothetical protein
MVHITPETVESFKQMFKKQYGVEYSDKEAWEATHNLLGAFEWLLKEDRKQHPENYQKNSEKQGGVKYVIMIPVSSYTITNHTHLP